MSAILSFLLWCVALAACVCIGGFVLNILLAIGSLLIIGIVGGISWLWQKLTGNSQ